MQVLARALVPGGKTVSFAARSGLRDADQLTALLKIYSSLKLFNFRSACDK